MTFRPITALLLLLPFAAGASGRCEYREARQLQLDLAGVRTVMFDIGANDLEVEATATPANRIEGDACASGAALLPKLVLSQLKQGDRLVVRAERRDTGFSLGNTYAYMKLRASVPDSVLVQLDVGSGDASIEGARAASVDIGSGDVRAHRIRGAFTVKAGSGDVQADGIGSLDVLSVGSGDLNVHDVGGPSKIGDLGSGDVSIRGTRGPVTVGSVGSGDLDLRGIGGNVTVGSVGSGDVSAHDIRGDLVVRSIRSGDVDHGNVSGRVDVPRNDD